MDPKPLIVICGQTASGKTDLAIKLARKYKGEIICADSRTVYRGMDIGTAKPTHKQQKLVKHHLVDVVSPNRTFTVYDFKKLANQAIEEIGACDKLPFLVGGSGLYIDSIIFDYDFSPDIPRDQTNPRHSENKVDQNNLNMRSDTIVVGLRKDNAILKKRIELRAKKAFVSGLIEETRLLSNKYGLDAEALNTPLYNAAKLVIKGEVSADKAIFEAVSQDVKLAKKQFTWFKRNNYIHWVETEAEADKLVEQFLTS